MQTSAGCTEPWPDFRREAERAVARRSSQQGLQTEEFACSKPAGLSSVSATSFVSGHSPFPSSSKQLAEDLEHRLLFKSALRLRWVHVSCHVRNGSRADLG